MSPTKPVNANHAFLCGQVFAALHRLGEGDEFFVVRSIMDGADYTNTVEIERPSGTYRVSVEPSG